MKAIAMIPARYEASRFPGKLMQLLGDKTVIRRTYEAALHTGLFDEVWVVTDSDQIASEINSIGGKVLRSKQAHESGTDRIAEVARDMAFDIIVNVQGDSPFIKKEPLLQLLQAFTDPFVQVGSLMRPLTQAEDIQNPNVVKVVVNQKNDSIFFSRSVIPFPRDPQQAAPYYEHVGVYAFRKKTLFDFTSWSLTPLEKTEKLECLRLLEHGVPIRMVLTPEKGVEIDTPEDLEKARGLLGL
ncbi:MAG: 3-deoxy-manno-octulosonate cytidylyltransferase [Sphingomonadales bacterium]|nr:3-deoxy-manno-octulosonate cytidylyltransferase [Sphingomonadales bacterium]